MGKRTVLLDLDGTLLPLGMDDFLTGYFDLLTKEFASLFESDKFVKYIMAATSKMIANDGTKLNSEVFIENFCRALEIDDQQEIMAKFDNFYLEIFPRLGLKVNSSALASRLIKKLKDAGHQLVLATNPIFPLEAIVERLRWVDIDPADFIFITNYNNMHYCKPNIAYYQEIVNKLELNPMDCIMIGNDVQEDMIAGRLGIKTYLVTDFLIDRNKGTLNCDWQGSFQELFNCF